MMYLFITVKYQLSYFTKTLNKLATSINVHKETKIGELTWPRKEQLLCGNYIHSKTLLFLVCNTLACACDWRTTDTNTRFWILNGGRSADDCRALCARAGRAALFCHTHTRMHTPTSTRADVLSILNLFRE